MTASLNSMTACEYALDKNETIFDMFVPIRYIGCMGRIQKETSIRLHKGNLAGSSPI